jgi:hypothetical protein
MFPPGGTLAISISHVLAQKANGASFAPIRVGEINSKEALMKLKIAVLATMVLLPGSLMVNHPALAQSKSETIHPDPNASRGGSKSERGGGGVPLPKGSPQSGTVDMGTSKSESTAPNASGKPSTTKNSGKSSDTTVGKDSDQPNQTPKQ